MAGSCVGCPDRGARQRQRHPPEDLPHIFKRFYRSRFSKDTQGIGLGLALTKAIVEAHNGTIELDSEPGAGTFTINFRIPTKL